MNITNDDSIDRFETEIPQDLEAAQKIILALRSENKDLIRQNEEQKEQIRIFRLREFAPRSEKRTIEDIRQGRLFDEAEQYSTAPLKKDEVEIVRVKKTVYTRKKRGRKPLSPKLARIDLIIDVSDEEKNAVPVGYELKNIGEETSEQVHEIPQKYVVIRTIRPKYIIKPQSGSEAKKLNSPVQMLIAPVPPRILPRSIATPSLLASVLTGKFCNAVPF